MSADLTVDVSRERRASRRHGGLALAVIAVAQLMVSLDATVVAVALPHIQRALGFSGSCLQWVVTGYALFFGGMVLLGGRLGDVVGRRQALVAGVGLFTVASLAGGLARVGGPAAGRPVRPGGGRGRGRARDPGADRDQLRGGARLVTGR